MTFTKRNEKLEQVFDTKSSDISTGSEDSYLTDEEINSTKSFSGSLGSFENIVITNDRAARKVVKNTSNSQSCRTRAVSLRYGKLNRRFRSKIKLLRVSKQKKCKKFPDKIKTNLEKPAEPPKKGKRCRSGSKAKGKPLQEESRDKFDSDDDSDNFYFGRVSLGYFQKFTDKNGASTSYQWEEDHKSAITSSTEEKVIYDDPSEEMELLELQKWGRTDLVTSYKAKTYDFVKDEDIKPDKL